MNSDLQGVETNENVPNYHNPEDSNKVYKISSAEFKNTKATHFLAIYSNSSNDHWMQGNSYVLK